MFAFPNSAPDSLTPKNLNFVRALGQTELLGAVDVVVLVVDVVVLVVLVVVVEDLDVEVVVVEVEVFVLEVLLFVEDVVVTGKHWEYP